MRVPVYLPVVAIAVLALASPAVAQAPRPSLADLAPESAIIAAVRVVEVRTLKDVDGNLMERVVARPLRSWRGDPVNPLEFDVPEGAGPASSSAANRATPSVVRPERDASYLVALERLENGTLQPAAIGLGIWRIRGGIVEGLGFRLDDVGYELARSGAAKLPGSEREQAPLPEISELMTAGPGAIRFSLQRGGKVSAGVYDLAGRLVFDFPTLYLEAGAHTLRWGGQLGDGDHAAHGLYFVRVRLADGATASTKVIWSR